MKTEDTHTGSARPSDGREGLPRPDGAPTRSPWLAVAVYFLVVIGFASLVAPWIFAGLGSMALQSERNWEFHRVFNRVLMLSAVIGAFFLLASQKVLSRQTLGLARSSRALPHFLLGASVSIAVVVLVMAIGFAVGAMEWDRDIVRSRLAYVTFTNLLAALVIGVVEETFFRGCLLGWLRQRINPSVALAAVTFFYAISHFMTPPAYAVDAPVHWYSGFWLLSLYPQSLFRNWNALGEFVMLALLGLTLGWCFLRTSRLYLSIGLHGGVVFAGKMMNFVTDTRSDVARWWFGSGRILGSPVAILAVAAVFVVMLWICSRPNLRNA